MTASLSQRLRSETRDAHTSAERSGIMRRILRGKVDGASYVALLRNLHAIYESLEGELARHASLPELAFIDLPVLARTAAIAADLDALATEDWRASTLTSAATAYVAHLHALGDTDPAMLIAHAYLRYLGDLSGGQMLRAVIARSLSLSAAPETRGLASYEFPRIADVAAFKNAFRAALDRATVDADAIVAETQLGYRMHESLFEQIEVGAAA